jgi:hypothetical protein
MGINMRLIKGVIFAFAGLFTVVTLFSLLMPSQVMTVRSVVIHAKPDRVFTEIADLEKWKQWHPVFIQDSTSMHFSETTSGVHSFAEWTTNGKKNKLLIDEVLPGQLKATLTRPGERDVNNYITVTALKDSNNVQAEWRVITKLKWFPWEKFSGIFIDKMTGPGYETALNNLKERIEGKPTD